MRAQTADSRKSLLSDMFKLPKDNFHPLGTLRGILKNVSKNLISDPHILRFCSSMGSRSCSSASTPIALGLGFQVHWAKTKPGFPASSLFASGRLRTNCAILLHQPKKVGDMALNSDPPCRSRSDRGGPSGPNEKFNFLCQKNMLLKTL